MIRDNPRAFLDLWNKANIRSRESSKMTRLIKLFVSLFLCFCTEEVFANSCGRDELDNFITGLYGGFTDVVQPCCTKHDACYGQQGSHRHKCDEDFKICMEQMTRNNEDNEHLKVSLFHLAVRAFGGSAFSKAQTESDPFESYLDSNSDIFGFDFPEGWNVSKASTLLDASQHETFLVKLKKPIESKSAALQELAKIAKKHGVHLGNTLDRLKNTHVEKAIRLASVVSTQISKSQEYAQRPTKAGFNDCISATRSMGNDLKAIGQELGIKDLEKFGSAVSAGADIFAVAGQFLPATALSGPLVTSIGTFLPQAALVTGSVVAITSIFGKSGRKRGGSANAASGLSDAQFHQIMNGLRTISTGVQIANQKLDIIIEYLPKMETEILHDIAKLNGVVIQGTNMIVRDVNEVIFGDFNKILYELSRGSFPADSSSFLKDLRTVDYTYGELSIRAAVSGSDLCDLDPWDDNLRNHLSMSANPVMHMVAYLVCFAKKELRTSNNNWSEKLLAKESFPNIDVFASALESFSVLQMYIDLHPELNTATITQHINSRSSEYTVRHAAVLDTLNAMHSPAVLSVFKMKLLDATQSLIQWVEHEGKHHHSVPFPQPTNIFRIVEELSAEMGHLRGASWTVHSDYVLASKFPRMLNVYPDRQFPIVDNPEKSGTDPRSDIGWFCLAPQNGVFYDRGCEQFDSSRSAREGSRHGGSIMDNLEKRLRDQRTKVRSVIMNHDGFKSRVKKIMYLQVLFNYYFALFGNDATKLTMFNDLEAEIKHHMLNDHGKFLHPPNLVRSKLEKTLDDFVKDWQGTKNTLAKRLQLWTDYKKTGSAVNDVYISEDTTNGIDDVLNNAVMDFATFSKRVQQEQQIVAYAFEAIERSIAVLILVTGNNVLETESLLTALETYSPLLTRSAASGLRMRAEADHSVCTNARASFRPSDVAAWPTLSQLVLDADTNMSDFQAVVDKEMKDNYSNLVRLLNPIETGTAPTAVNHQWRRPLHLAIVVARTDMIELLLQNDALVDDNTIELFSYYRHCFQAATANRLAAQFRFYQWLHQSSRANVHTDDVFIAKALSIVEECDVAIHSSTPEPVSDAILVIGDTKSGKSTLINNLNGVCYNPQWQHLEEILVVDKTKCDKDEFASTSHSYISETTCPMILKAEVRSNEKVQMMNTVDTAGFQDTRGTAFSVGSGVAFQALSGYIASVRLIAVVVTKNHLTSGTVLQRAFEIAGALVASDKSKMANIVVVLNKVSAEHSAERVQALFQALLSSRGSPKQLMDLSTWSPSALAVLEAVATNLQNIVVSQYLDETIRTFFVERFGAVRSIPSSELHFSTAYPETDGFRKSIKEMLKYTDELNKGVSVLKRDLQCRQVELLTSITEYLEPDASFDTEMQVMEERYKDAPKILALRFAIVKDQLKSLHGTSNEFLKWAKKSKQQLELSGGLQCLETGAEGTSAPRRERREQQANAALVNVEYALRRMEEVFHKLAEKSEDVAVASAHLSRIPQSMKL